MTIATSGGASSVARSRIQVHKDRVAVLLSGVTNLDSEAKVIGFARLPLRPGQIDYLRFGHRWFKRTSTGAIPQRYQEIWPAEVAQIWPTEDCA